MFSSIHIHFVLSPTVTLMGFVSVMTGKNGTIPVSVSETQW